MNLEKEIGRLLIGFKETIGSSEMKRTLHEMTTIISTPVWQKATFWVVCQYSKVDIYEAFFI